MGFNSGFKGLILFVISFPISTACSEFVYGDKNGEEWVLEYFRALVSNCLRQNGQAQPVDAFPGRGGGERARKWTSRKSNHLPRKLRCVKLRSLIAWCWMNAGAVLTSSFPDVKYQDALLVHKSKRGSADSLLTTLIMSLLQHLQITHFFASHTSIKVQKWGFNVASCSRRRSTTFDPLVQTCHVRDAEWSHKLSLHFGILGWKVAKIRHFSNYSAIFLPLSQYD